MKVRGKTSNIEWYSSKFNPSTLDEIIIEHEDYGADSVYGKDFDVWLESKQEWKDLKQAFADHDLITDSNFTSFFEPETEEDKERGYTLT